MDADYPAAHSMDTEWFAVDRCGHVALFQSGEAGAMPLSASVLTGPDGGDEELAKRLFGQENADDEHEYPDTERIGFFRFEHETENWISGPYLRLGTPSRPVRLEDLPAALREQISQFRFSSLCFGESQRIQPIEHAECISWEAAWLDVDKKRARPIPGQEDEYRQVYQELAGDTEEGITWEPPKGEQPPKAPPKTPPPVPPAPPQPSGLWNWLGGLFGGKRQPSMPPLVLAYRRLAEVLRAIMSEIECEILPGITAKHLDQVAEAAILRAGVQSSFKGYRGYPAFITCSLNEEVLNTIPAPRAMKEGDLLKLQVGIKDGSAHSYQAWTYFVSTPNEADRRFVDCGQRALAAAVGQVRAGGDVASISQVISSEIESGGYSVNRKFVGHGMGEVQHEDPQIPGYPIPGYSAILPEGKIVSIQVIAHQGSDDCKILDDNWNTVTCDGSKALLLNQIVVATQAGPDVILGPRNCDLHSDR